MSLLETFRLAVRALLRNKMRSFLTALGIIIGVGAVIAMVAIGEGAKAKVEEAFASMGTNLLVVMSGSSRSGGMMGGHGSLPTLTWDDLAAIQTELPSVKLAAPQLRTNTTVVGDELNWTTTVYGVTPEYFDIRNWGMAQGEVFTQSDVDTGAKVLIVGKTVAEKLFGPGADPLGATVRIKKVPFLVVALMESKGQSAMGQDLDDAVFVPESTWRARVQGGLANFIPGAVMVQAVSTAATGKAQKEIRELLRERHRLTAEADDDFSIRNLSEVASAQQEGTKTLTTLLAAVAAVSLLVGGIGIMNIMLVSVTERTREIGIRMAVGARPRHILAQFLVEALTLSVLGGLLGVGLGELAAQRIAAQFGWPMLMRPDIMVISLVFSALVGITFGLYPAQKAARLDPIEALRYE